MNAIRGERNWQAVGLVLAEERVVQGVCPDFSIMRPVLDLVRGILGNSLRTRTFGFGAR